MANGTIAFDTLSTSGQISGTAKSVDTDYLAYGSAKAWGMFDMTLSSSYVLDSFNNGSYTDHEAGEATFTFTNVFGNANYSVGNTTARCAGTDARLYTHLNFEYELDNTGTAPATGSLRICAGRTGTSADSPTRTDLARASLNFFGDLA